MSTNPRDWSIRSAELRDAGAIAAIYNEAVRTTVATFDTAPRSVGAQRRWLAEHAGRLPVLVAERDGAVLGWASLSAWSDRRAYDGTAEVSVYVRQMDRGRGIGRHLLEELIRTARERALHTLLSRIADRNPPSTHLHRSLGFRSVGVMREVGFKFERWVDVELFERILEPVRLDGQAPDPLARGRIAGVAGRRQRPRGSPRVSRSSNGDPRARAPRRRCGHGNRAL